MKKRMFNHLIFDESDSMNSIEGRETDNEKGTNRTINEAQAKQKLKRQFFGRILLWVKEILNYDFIKNEID